jgi:hypothetical protein
MAARVCHVCNGWVIVPREDDDEIGVFTLRMPRHKRGKVKTAEVCPASGTVIKVVAERACGRCGRGIEGEHDFDCLDAS